MALYLLFKTIDTICETVYIFISIPAAPLLSMRNSVGFFIGGGLYAI
jgi:hypothetical protein